MEPETRQAIDDLAGLIDVDGASAVRIEAIGANGRGPDVWVRGDVTGSNWLLRDDGLFGVSDFGCAAVGDPACDLTPAWTMFEGNSTERFMAALPVDERTWAWARG